MAHAIHSVTFTGDNNAQQYAIVKSGDPHAMGDLDLIVWEDPGWEAKNDVPHGSAEQGYTWH